LVILEEKILGRSFLVRSFITHYAIIVGVRSTSSNFTEDGFSFFDGRTAFFVCLLA
jgi:hypothetical protein